MCFRCCCPRGRRHNPRWLTVSVAIAILGVFAVFGVGSERAMAQVADQHTADVPNPRDGADPRTTAYRDCHKGSTEILYREHPMCQPGIVPHRAPAATVPCPYSGGDRMAEIMRRSAECMRAKGY
jgi:hypothetical protein